MRRGFSIAALLGLGAGLAYVVHDRGLDRMLLGDTRLGAPPSEVATPWKTEEEWLAGEVARDIVEMAFYARHRRPPTPGEATVHAKSTGAPGVSPIRITISADGTPDATVDLPVAFIWGPDEYAPVARMATERMGLNVAAPPESGRDAEGSLAALTEPTLAVLETENQRVSARLAAHPQDPAAHESAALVLAALALREAAGLSHEVRPTLARMAAHLALADSWGQGAHTPDGLVARAALLVLAQRGEDAESAASQLPSARPAERAWREALLIHVTDDWRRLAEPRNSTAIERRAHLRATMRANDASAALEHLGALAHDEADYAELARLAVTDTTAISVEVGNRLLPLGLATEEAGLAEIHAMVHGTPLAASAGALAAAHQRAITTAGPRVIGWGTWSAYFGRHLLHQMTLDEMHTRLKLALPAQADAKGLEYDAKYGSLPQYSFLQDRRESHGGIRPTRFAESVSSTIEQPEQVTAFHFFVTEDLAAREVIRRGPARRAAWFDPPLPRGTTFDLGLRRQALGYEPKGADVEALRLISPRDPAVLVLVAAAHPKGTPIDDLEKRLGPRLEYDVAFIQTLADAVKEDRPQVRMLYARLCEAGGPTWCAPLGVLLVEEGEDMEAAPILRRYFDAIPDRVAASWYAPWLVRHYLDNGSPGDARTVADEAESTGSGSGLRAMVALHERQGRFSEAEAVLLAIRERYGDDARSDPPEQDDDDPLIAFYHRMANVRGDAAYSERFTELAARTFPAGLEKLDPAALTPQSATEGVAILTASATTRRLGLKPGDVIVGVDGYRVRTLRQYEVARGFREGTEMDLHVWRHPGFQTITTRTWNRGLETDLRTNAPGEPTNRG